MPPSKITINAGSDGIAHVVLSGYLKNVTVAPAVNDEGDTVYAAVTANNATGTESTVLLATSSFMTAIGMAAEMLCSLANTDGIDTKGLPRTSA